MPNKDFAGLMARYNLWQNESMIAAAETLSDEDRERECGAFFGSIRKTASHVLWGDMNWMSKFAGTPAPEQSIVESVALAPDWTAYTALRTAFDRTILEWTRTVPTDWFDGEIAWFSMAAGREISKPKRLLICHFFNHQTHHRGQIHALLTAAGADPGPTDLPFLPDRIAAL